MREVKKIVSWIAIVIATFIWHSSQCQSNLIANKDDYRILEKTVKDMTNHLVKYDSLDSLLIEKYRQEGNTLLLDYLLNRKSLRGDTIFILKIADSFYYKGFLTPGTSWPRFKSNEEFNKKYHDLIFTDFYQQYLKELDYNTKYLWDAQKMSDSIKIKVLEDFTYTRKQLDSIKYSPDRSLTRKLYSIDRDKIVYTITKPLYSKNEKYAIIVYVNPSFSHRVLKLYEKQHNAWIYLDGIYIVSYP